MTGWGVATSAFQVEGSAGRGPSTWDEFCTRPGAVKDGSDGVVACDSFHRWDEDLALLVDLGVDAYRFSISWPRVLSGGLDYYERVVDSLLDKGIRPFPTLFHWDTPLEVEQQGGWPVRDTALRFVDYALEVERGLGDRVTTWATMNEPWCTAFLGHAAGVFAPGVEVPELAFDAAHHLLLGHGLAAAALREQRPGAEVGIVLNLTVVRDDGGDPVAVDVVDALQNRLWLDALATGTYPAVLPSLQRHVEDLEHVRGSADWVGINSYTPFRIGPPAPASGAVGQDTDAFPGAPPFSFAPRPPLTTMGWEVDATGLTETLQRTAAALPGVPLRVTENGIACDDDADRVAYLEQHLAAVLASPVPVLDYFAWSLLDNFEWAQGYTQRFGLVSVEEGTLRRVPKPSFAWYRDFVARHR